MNTEELNSAVKDKSALKHITPKIAKQLLIDGNRRFTDKDMIERDHEWHIQQTKDSQHPFGIILGCIDSRVEPSIIFDQGIGDLFITRVVGNIINQDILGSMEYACAISGSKIIVILGHTSCGAVKGACDNIKLGNLTSTLRHIKLAIERMETPDNYDRSSKNIDFVNQVAHKNTEIAKQDVLDQSPILKEMFDKGEIDIVGAIYDHSTGKVDFCV